MQGQKDINADMPLQENRTHTLRLEELCLPLENMQGVIMDDLDHSIDIAENDWSSFCDESEECDLLQPSLAYPDDCSLSDAEEAGNSTSVAQQQTQRSPDANSDGKESNITEGMHAVSEQPDKSGRVDDVATSVKQVEICARCPGGDAISAEGMDSEAVEETSEGTTKTTTGALQADSINNQSSGEGTELRKDGYLQTKSDQNSSEELDHQELQNVNEPGTTDRTEVKVEKDRWFVTVNENPSRKRGHSSPLKKKHQRKSTNERSHMSNVQEGSMGNDADQEKMKMESNAVKDTESHQSKSLGNKQTNGDLSATLVEAWVDFKSLEETTKECKPALSASALMESCDDFEEFSSHSSDAAHREGFPLQDLCIEKQLHQSTLPLTGDRHDFRSTNHTDQTKGQTHSSDRTSGTPTAVGWDCDESSSADGALTSAAQETSGSVREGSTCTNNTHSGTQSPPTEDLPASPLEDRLEHSQRLTPTPVSAADSPEMYARAEGNTRPVYAISAFWDDMEKLTINDILHLRMGTSRSPRHNPEAPHGDDLTDTGDTADSDYFTQSEESKPEQSGCEFSTSDFEEEYWQFVGVSRNASPDPDSKTQPSRFVSDDDTNSEGGAVPVPLEELAGQHSDSREPLTLFMEPKQMRKSKSLFNINDLKGKASPLLSLLDNGSLSLCAVQNLAENTDSVLNSLRRPVCSSLFCMDVPEIHHHMSFSEMLQYFFTETEVNVAYVQLYDPEDISVTPVFKCTCSTFLEHLPQTPVQDYRENPIPIFSSSPPTVRHLTFPKQHYASMSSHCEGLDKVSSIFTVPYSFLQAAGPHGASGAAVMGGSFCWKSLQSLRRISFLDKGSIWCGRSGVLTFPVETENTTVAAPREERAFPASPEVFRGVEEQQKGIQTFWTTKQYGIFSAVKQSDMCLVCIAFASWVLKSSDPDAADAWKAALLANVSALSAIQYLRQYVKKKGPL